MVSYRGYWEHEHIILDTDYENFALVYGCDNYFGVFHGRWATLLSRIEYAEVEYVERAKDILRDIDYDYNFWWVQSGETCGWEAAPTADSIMLNVFKTEPNWSDYGSYTIGTSRTKQLWT
jgi:hypothetical protein